MMLFVRSNKSYSWAEMSTIQVSRKMHLAMQGVLEAQQTAVRNELTTNDLQTAYETLNVDQILQMLRIKTYFNVFECRSAVHC